MAIPSLRHGTVKICFYKYYEKPLAQDATVTGRVVSILSTTDKLEYRSTIHKGMFIDVARALDSRQAMQFLIVVEVNKC